MANRIPVLLLGLLLATSACEQPTPPVVAEGENTFNLTAYLEQQQDRLQAEQPMVLKSVTTEGKPTETIQTAKVDWEDELSVFMDADLNRPALQEYYTRQEKVLDNGNIVVEFNRVEDVEPLVHYLRLELTPDRVLRQLNALIQDQNMLFYSRRNIQLSADASSGNISGYHVKGVQKMMLSDSLHYQIQANL